MENTNAVFEAIEYLATLKTKAKEEEMKECLQYPIFRTVMRAALDPFVTYGIKKFNNKRSHDMDNVRETMSRSDWVTLDKLASRELTGNAAIEAVEKIYYELHPKSAALFERILKKDLRAGFSAKLINKVMPGMIFVFECMLSHKYEEKRIKEWPVDVEPKLDGVRVLAINNGNGYRFFSRTGKEFHNFDHIAKTLNTLNNKNYVFDGEVVNKSGSFNETVGDVHKKGKQALNAVFHIFDVIPKENFEAGIWHESQQKRKILLNFLISELDNDGSVVEVRPKIAFNNDEIMDEYHAIRAEGGEGVIIKPRDGAYQCKRSYNWLKIKDQVSVDVQVKGLEVGTGKYENLLGALIVDFNGVEVNVGSGLTDQLREEFWTKPDNIIGEMVEIEYHEITPDGSLRHPRFVRMRTDKPVEDGIGV